MYKKKYKDKWKKENKREKMNEMGYQKDMMDAVQIWRPIWL